jgi:hypothetical protein
MITDLKYNQDSLSLSLSLSVYVCVGKEQTQNPLIHKLLLEVCKPFSKRSQTYLGILTASISAQMSLI